MRGGVDLLQRVNRHLGIGSVLVHQRRHGVTEQVAGAGLAEFGGVVRSFTVEVLWSRLNGSPWAVRNTGRSSGSMARWGRASRMYF
jgi:hypothetical protein